ncbi:MAG: hypothetical protein QOI98_1836, partial [Solirubrobacteraceae bacterium]|nr:hypothetical protein [Solirubrobacteraceae bacterium]
QRNEDRLAPRERGPVAFGAHYESNALTARATLA